MNQTWVDKLYDYIQEDILSWHLKPGQRLHIAQLAEQYNVGPGPVREALSRLLSTELVIAISQCGFRVAAVSLVDLRDIYKTRAQIEAIALKLSIEHGNDEWEANIIGSHHRLAKFEQETIIKNTEDYKQWEERHRQFNVALIGACDLSYLLRIQEHLYQLTERYRRQWLMAGLKKSKTLSYAKKQKQIMDATLARDVKMATELLLKHYDSAVEIIESYFETQAILTE